MPLIARPSRPRSLLSWLAGRVGPTHLSVARAGAGGVMVARPRLVPALLGVDSATSARMGWAVQMLGAREIALGLGTLVALRSPDRRAARLWVAAGVLSDGLDVLAVGAAVARGRLAKGTGGLVVVTAATSTALGAHELEGGGRLP